MIHEHILEGLDASEADYYNQQAVAKYMASLSASRGGKADLNQLAHCIHIPPHEHIAEPQSNSID